MIKNNINAEYLKIELLDKLKNIDCPYKSLYDIKMWLWNNHQLLVNAFIDSTGVYPPWIYYCIQAPDCRLNGYSTVIGDAKYKNIIDAINDGLIEALNYINNENEQQD